MAGVSRAAVLAFCLTPGARARSSTRDCGDLALAPGGRVSLLDRQTAAKISSRRNSPPSADEPKVREQENVG
jgi:hypothetical protein